MPSLALALVIVAGPVGCSDSEPVETAEVTLTVEPESGDIVNEEDIADWPIFRGDRALTGVGAGHLPDEPQLLWTFEAEGAIVSSPVVADGRVYFGSDDGNLYCVDVESGEKVWAYPTEFLIDAPPFYHDGLVYVGSNDFFFYALDAETGALEWKYETWEKIVGGANVVTGPDGRDLIVIGSHDAFVYALDAKTGEKAWEYETNDRVNATVAVIDNQIVFGGCDTILYMLDGATGEPTKKIELGGECHIAASVGIADHVAYFGHHANEFVAIDLETGEPKWIYPQARFGFYSPPAITDDRVVFGGRDKKLHCVDRETGEAIWTHPARRKIDAGPVVCGDKVVVGSGDGRLYMVRLSDGEEVWTYDVGKSVFSSPAIVDGMILVGANDGRLYAFGAKPAEPTRESS